MLHNALRQIAWVLVVVSGLAYLTACTTPPAEPTQVVPVPTSANEFKPRPVTVKLTGSGASFPDPIYQTWVKTYRTIVPTVEINYQSVGSGQGRKDFFGEVTDFGGTDKFASDTEMAQFSGTVLHIPTVLGAVVATYNLPDVEKLQFSGTTLADIYLGKIRKWNDPRIAADNPGVSLPELDITPVYRSDGSGTTSIFTNYLSNVSSEWQTTVGTGDSVRWPVGIGGEKNPGVAAAVKQIEGAIGYVELIYATANDLPAPAIKNASGVYVAPSLDTTLAAATSVLDQTPDDLRINIVNPQGENSYPIAGYTWILVAQEQTDQAKAQALTDFLFWALTDGSASVRNLGYAPLPDALRGKALAKIASLTVNGQPAFVLP
jgi:phosphate transport system substrate-binding protein